MQTTTLSGAIRAGTSAVLDEVFGPLAIGWVAVGAAWTIWCLGFALGTGAAYWGGLMAVTLLWSSAAAVDRLEQFAEIRGGRASIMRASSLGLIVIALPRVVFHPGDALAVWLTAMTFCGALYFAAPLLGRSPAASTLWRTWVDLKRAGAFAGGFVFVIMLGSSIATRWGFGISEGGFIAVIVAATACLGPTVLSWRATAFPVTQTGVRSVHGERTRPAHTR